MFKSPIAIGLSPNTQNDDIWQAIDAVCRPWMWKEGNAINKIEKWFERYFSTDKVFLFNSGRSALYSVLKSFGIGKGDQVLLQAFTCVAVPDPIIWVGARPVYVDIDETGNIDYRLLEKNINEKTKAIIVQHNFGIPAKIKLIKEITQKYNLVLIEDCAHSLGATVGNKKIGTFGDAAIFSFGRDKVISSVFGGMAMINSKFKIQNSKLQEFQKRLNYPSYFWIFQQLLHPIVFALILPLYNLIIGKVLLALLLKLKFLSKPVYKEEFNGGKPDVFPTKYPNALAMLLLCQLNKLEFYNKTRIRIANYYFDKLKNIKNIRLPSRLDGAIYMRFNILTPIATDVLNRAKERGILLGNWYRNIIDPKGVNYEKVGFKVCSCPKAEETAKLSVNLPTYSRLTITELNSIINLFQ